MHPGESRPRGSHSVARSNELDVTSVHAEDNFRRFPNGDFLAAYRPMIESLGFPFRAPAKLCNFPHHPGIG
jgi:hypothetical protein